MPVIEWEVVHKLRMTLGLMNGKVHRMESPRRNRVFVMVLIWLSGVIALGCGTGAQKAISSKPTVSTAGQPISFAAAGCPLNAYSALKSQSLEQSMDGAVNGCFRVGALAPGHYWVGVDVVGVSQGASATKGYVVPVRSQIGPAVKLTLSPSSGSPGSLVRIYGTLASPISVPSGQIQLCWDGCESGLRYSGVPIKWISPTEFEATMTIPAAPWFGASGDRVSLLTGGENSISMGCLTVIKGCSLGAPEGSAVFNLYSTSGIAPWCTKSSSCGKLGVSETAVFPGNVIKVTGFVPLITVLGSDHPYQYALKISPGLPPTSEMTLSSATNGAAEMLIGHGAFTVGAPPSLASLNTSRLGEAVYDGASPVSENPANPGQVAWCSGGEIGVVGPSGKESFSTVAAGRELKSLGFGLMGASLPNCVSVALADAGSAGKMIVAAFIVAPHFQAPPFVTVALETSNKGGSWSPIPVPSGASSGGFAGFRYKGSSLLALFAPNGGGKNAGTNPSSAAVPLVEVLHSGESTWASGTFQCPASGPCVAFGSYLPGNCAMNGSTQAILYSKDGGVSWQAASWPDKVQACWATQMVPISPAGELLISTGSQYLVRESTDGGMRWTVVSMPLPPGAAPGGGMKSLGSDLQMLSSGTMLLTGQRGGDYGWYILLRGAKSWCPVKGLPAGAERSAEYSQVHQVGGTLYWVQNGGSLSSVLRTLPIASLKC